MTDSIPTSADAGTDGQADTLLADDAIFEPEITVGLYVRRAFLAGAGANAASHVPIHHLTNTQEPLGCGLANE